MVVLIDTYWIRCRLLNITHISIIPYIVYQLLRLRTILSTSVVTITITTSTSGIQRRWETFVEICKICVLHHQNSCVHCIGVSWVYQTTGNSIFCSAYPDLQQRGYQSLILLTFCERNQWSMDPVPLMREAFSHHDVIMGGWIFSYHFYTWSFILRDCHIILRHVWPPGMDISRCYKLKHIYVNYTYIRLQKIYFV